MRRGVSVRVRGRASAVIARAWNGGRVDGRIGGIDGSGPAIEVVGEGAQRGLAARGEIVPTQRRAVVLNARERREEHLSHGDAGAEHHHFGHPEGDRVVPELLGAQPPTPEWGTMLADAREFVLRAWWVVTFPGLAILITVLAFNLMGDGLRDALDPKMKRS